MARRDYYEILGVPRSATPEQVKAAYRKLARQYHPDVNKNAGAADRFKEATAAYEILADPEKRRLYDQFGHAGLGEGAAGPAGARVHTWTGPAGRRPFGGGGISFDFDDLFASSPFAGMSFDELMAALGGGARRGQAGRVRAPRGMDAEAEIALDFLQAAKGCTTTLQLRNPDGGTERIDVKIPPGVREASKVRVRGKGHAGPGGAGDLYIITHVREHPYFRRSGADIYVDLPISVAEAAAGAAVAVPTLDGPAELRVPPGTSSGTQLRMRGKGIPDPKTGQRGNQYVVVKIVLPRSISQRGRELLQEFEKTDPYDPREKVPW